MSDYGSHSMTAPLRRVAVRHPPAALAQADPDLWHYTSTIDLQRARNEHDHFVALLRQLGAEVEFIHDDPDALPDSMFTYDASMVTREGAVLMRMGKALRRQEVSLHKAFFEKAAIPILGSIEAPATLEAGDTLWIDEDTLAVGRGYRTNDEGVHQITVLMSAIGVEVIPFDLPVFHGADSCLHLMSLLSLLADDLALAHRELLPVRLLQLLEQRGFQVLTAPADEFESSNTISGNVLTIRPRSCLMVDRLAKTRRILEEADCEINTFPAEDLCLKAEGGPTCLTRPLQRA